MAEGRRLQATGGAACLAVAGALLGACAAGPPLTAGFGDPGCVATLAAADAAIEQAGVSDAGSARIAGFPAHRVDRFLAGFRDRLSTAAAFDGWADRLRRLDREARGIELANLPAADRSALAERIAPAATGSVDAVVEACAESLHARTLAEPALRTALLARAEAPDHYRGWDRVMGLYGLTAAPIAVGYSRWRAEAQAAFASHRPLDGVDVVTYAPPSSAPLPPEEVAAMIEASRYGALDIPEPDAATRARLLAAFAPVFRIGTRSDDDRIGSPRLAAPGAAEVDTDEPVVFTRLSHGWWQGRPLLQLNYGIWFPARTVTGSFDLLGGHMDGLWWRVTIAPDGRPLVYDTIHQCGCYHMLFPRPGLEAIDPYPPGDIRERPFVPRTAPAAGAGERVVLSLTPVAHYLVALDVASNAPDPAVTYRLRDDDSLRSLPLAGGGTRSLFAPDGLVPGTERLERYLLWPMGIAEPGAMRQWGTHAIAFVGRRHFDDPSLLEEAFRP